MAGVAAMHDLAMLDRDEHINPTRKRTHPNYPGAFLNFAPFGKEGGRITVRWAMFLVNAATQAMMRQQRYETSVFFGWYKGVGVGSILFNRATADSVDVPTTTSIEPQKLQNLLPATDPHLLPRPSIVARDTGTSFNVTGTRLAAGDQLYAQVDFVGKTMDMRDALMAIIYLLMSLGGRHNQPLGFYNCIMHAVTVEVRTIFNRIDDPRHATYDLTSGDMVNMMAGLAVTLLRENKFSELDIMILDRGVKISRGAMRIKPLVGTNVPLKEVNGTGMMSVDVQ
ncbi:MAG: hypothetical protein L6R41_002129 [Letrouitia leprolyta]|nr:MAG: hypothetical protein L6R41_002129 [Letrouitia leprolyta]